MKKEILKPYGMAESDLKKLYEKTKKNGKKGLYSKSSYLRLISLLSLFDVNIEYLCYMYAPDKKNYEKEDYWKNRKNLFCDIPRYKSNHGSIILWYQSLGKTLENNDNHTCDKCLTDIISEAKKKICEDSRKHGNKEPECKIINDYKEFFKFFFEFYISAFNSLKIKINVKDDWKKCLYMHTILPGYNIKVPRNGFINEFAISIETPIDQVYTQEFDLFDTLLNKLCKIEICKLTLSSFKENWDIIFKICQNDFLAKKLMDLITNSPEDLNIIVKHLLQKMQGSDFILENANNYGFLLNYQANTNTKNINVMAIVSFFLKKFDDIRKQDITTYDLKVIEYVMKHVMKDDLDAMEYAKKHDLDITEKTNPNPVIFCLEISSQLAVYPNGLDRLNKFNRYLIILFLYACMKQDSQ